MATIPTTTKRLSGVPATIIPDRAIGAIFALFPIVVAAFLSVQAVRAAGMTPDADTARAQATIVAR